MGRLVDGEWRATGDGATDGSGRYQRRDTAFRNWITPDGAPGPTGDGGFPAEPGRYLLYVSYACPWAHRTLLMRALKGLEAMIDVAVVHWFMGADGWSFAPGPGATADPVAGAAHLHQVYTRAAPRYTGRVSVPVLWDRARDAIVSNESADILRMLNSAFDGVGARPGDYAPPALAAELAALNAEIYEHVNNGVYKCGFATTQAAYDAAVGPLFATLDALERRLADQRHLLGAALTEADLRLFPTLYRFDAVYNIHFKCSVRRLVDHPNLWAYARDLHQRDFVRGTLNMEHVRRHYYTSHESINPMRITPTPPAFADFDAPHGRDALQPE